MDKPSRRAVHGILLLDKPKGISSNTALQTAKRLFNARKAGHTGSLDPMATGMLPLCFGEATKVSQYLIDCDKRYRASMRLGITTNTGDAEGVVLSEKAVEGVDASRIEKVLAHFRGDIEQIPPMFSALKHQGKRLYKLALKGIEVDRPPRPVTIYQLDFCGYHDNIIDIDVHCSKGTYIRTLAEDIGQQLGCGAHLVALRRYAVGNYIGQTPIALADLQSGAQESDYDQLDKQLLPLDSGLAHLSRLDLDDSDALRLRNGLRIPLEGDFSGQLIRLYSPSEGFFGLGEQRSDGKLASRRIFHFSV
ncbi:MAG: tRNA pseudouridine(55) synthase TruB [Gammaproteobacteria bacterium]|nr:MAG: tRNA pseudouridine(55) synthase TruB [Gammaproteobacteria bacterium]PCH63655.1 MAG: tRNA pseudouridine(55) synthase TruB [Gammaproteobacteria bacterium]